MERSEGGLFTSTTFRYVILAIFCGGLALFFLFGRAFVGTPITLVMWTSGEKMNYLKDIVLQFTNPQYGRIKPSPPVLRELEQLYEKQEEVMRGIVQEVTDIDATLSGFIQEGDEKQLVLSMQAWKKSLGSRWETLKELLEQS